MEPAPQLGLEIPAGRLFSSRVEIIPALGPPAGSPHVSSFYFILFICPNPSSSHSSHPFFSYSAPKDPAIYDGSVILRIFLCCHYCFSYPSPVVAFLTYMCLYSGISWPTNYECHVRFFCLSSFIMYKMTCVYNILCEESHFRSGPAATGPVCPGPTDDSRAHRNNNLRARYMSI